MALLAKYILLSTLTPKWAALTFNHCTEHCVPVSHLHVPHQIFTPTRFSTAFQVSSCSTHLLTARTVQQQLGLERLTSHLHPVGPQDLPAPRKQPLTHSTRWQDHIRLPKHLLDPLVSQDHRRSKCLSRIVEDQSKVVCLHFPLPLFDHTIAKSWFFEISIVLSKLGCDCAIANHSHYRKSIAHCDQSTSLHVRDRSQIEKLVSQCLFDISGTIFPSLQGSHSFDTSNRTKNHYTSLVHLILKKYFAMHIKKSMQDQADAEKHNGNAFHSARIFRHKWILVKYCLWIRNFVMFKIPWNIWYTIKFYCCLILYQGDASKSSY